MSISIIIDHEHDDVLNTDCFVKQIREKWPEIKIHFISDPDAPIFQFRTEGLLGDFLGTGVWYTTFGGSKEDACFELW